MAGIEASTRNVEYLVTATFQSNTACNLVDLPLREGRIQKFILYACAQDQMTVSAVTTTEVTVGATTIYPYSACTNELPIIPDPTLGFGKIVIQMGGSGCTISAEP